MKHHQGSVAMDILVQREEETPVRRDSHLLNLMFHRSNDPDYVDNREIHTRLHDYKTLVVQRPKNAFFTKSVCFRGGNLWNNLDPLDKQMITIERFKHRQRSVLKRKLA